MKICKDAKGYFVLTSNNQKVTLYYKGVILTRFPTMFHIGNAYWHKNYKDKIEPEGYEVIIDNISSFKALRFEINNYYIDLLEDKAIEDLFGDNTQSKCRGIS